MGFSQVPASFDDSGVRLSKGQRLDLETFCVARDSPVDTSQHGEGIAELHVTGEGGESMVYAFGVVGHEESALQHGNCVLVAAQAAVYGGGDVEAHGEVQAVVGASLEGSGCSDGVV